MVFSRIRHNLIRGDFDRSANQQRVIRGIQAKVRARAHEPGFLEQGVLNVMQYLHTDLSPAELFKLAQAVAQVNPSKITTCVVQGGIGDVGGASVVLPYTDQARRLGDRARNDATLESCD
jgi:anionic cell wall polymer biosynthesis LytR-Cps2A-Psr (LCP) family protein